MLLLLNTELKCPSNHFSSLLVTRRRIGVRPSPPTKMLKVPATMEASPSKARPLCVLSLMHPVYVPLFKLRHETRGQEITLGLKRDTISGLLGNGPMCVCGCVSDPHRPSENVWCHVMCSGRMCGRYLVRQSLMLKGAPSACRHAAKRHDKTLISDDAHRSLLQRF